ncbi:hypothetical protein PDJAM_G00195870 [Pangasius djambal]|uniref:Uncharacterized protein n=1 Tax=Pangasius djambal TaxID=1691987 RepID=A0ACC5Y6V6_9TELE|nr:hypothetical protein [Pangasius djambal]
MGFLGGEITVDNRTPYRWTVCIETQKPWLFYDRYNTFDVGPHTKTQQSQILLTKWGQTIYLKVKYGQCSETECCTNPDLWYIFDPRDDPCFTIRESGDHWNIHLDCNVNYEEKKSTCPNYERIEDDAREEEENRRRAEEQRRQAQLERERRIEEQIRRESELSAKKLEQGTETLKQKQKLRGHEFHHQTHIMQQTVNTEIERDEVPEIEKKFRELSLEYQILQDEDSEETLADRMKTLQNELMVEYCKKHNLSSSCVFSFDTAVGYETLPLHDRLTVLEEVMRLVLEENKDDHTHKHDRDFLLDVLELLQDDHPSLAFNLLESLLQTDMQLSAQSKEILCQIAFNNTWKLAEITDFMRYIFRKDKEQVQSILHIAQTYKLEYGNVFSALTSPDPLRSLKSYADKERHKNAVTIISEMRKANYPENVLIILEDVLGYLEMELPKHKTADLSENEIHNIKKMVKELDFNNPDRQVLKSVLVGMSVAVKISSSVTIQRGKKEIVIEGYLPRLTQLATLVVFLLPKSKTNTGCLLEIGTGEGKSCILAMLAAIHAIRGVKVDIVTSSPVLACRDLEEWSGLYNMFGITSSSVPPMLNDVSSEKQDELTQEAYKQQIIYSTVGTFAADTLKQEFEKKTTRGDRRFELVLVDEVDYMTLDNGVQITFLSHESSGLQHLEQVLAGIWAMVSACRPIEVAAGVLICGMTAGSMSSFGLGLISEGVSDMISGVMEETYPGTDPAAGAIKLMLTKSPRTSPGNEGILNKLKRSIKAEDIPQSGHIDIIRPDGSRETVKSSNQNCLFHAVIQATTNDPNNVVLQKAKELRRKVSDEILLKPNKYVDAVKIQNIFNMTNSSNKYKIQAGVRECDLEQYTKYTKNKTPKQIIEEYKLGKVGDHKCLLDMEKPTAGVVEAQHIPPKSTWTEVLHLIKTNPEISSSLDRKNKEAFYLMMKMKHDPNGKMQLCMNTLSSDRRRALISGNSAESRACRHFLTSIFSSGDTEKVLKLSLIMAHPQCSDHIWNDLGIHHHFRTCDAGLAVMDRNDYYKRGFKEIVKKYSKWDLIDPNQTIRLIKWVQKDTFLDTSTVEYKEIINVIKDAKKKREEERT